MTPRSLEVVGGIDVVSTGFASSHGVLPLRTKVLWSSAGLGAEALNQSRNTWLVYFYAPPPDAGHQGWLPLATVSLLLFVGKFIEAFDDILIGYWSDRTSSRLGRRLPFILLATPPMALCSVLLFMPPKGTSSGLIAVYFFVVLELFFLFSTLVSAPYEALLPEIAQTGQERVSLGAWRVYCGIVGAGIGLVGSGILISRFGFPTMASVIALVALVSRYAGLIAVWRHASRTTPPTRLSLTSSIRTAFANRAFLAFMPSFALFGIALAMLIGLLPFYVTGILRQAEEGKWVALLTAAGIGSMALAVPIFARRARRLSKQDAYRRAMLAAALAFPVLSVAGAMPGIPDLAQVVAAMIVVGAPMAGVFLFPGPIMADICDDDARRHGIRREATFYSTIAFTEKVATSFAPLLLGLILLLGNSAEHPLGIRLVGPTAGLIVLAGYLIYRSYDLPEGEAD